MIHETELHLLSKTAISLGRATGFDVDTLQYIPGRAVRGAVAQAYLESGGRADSEAFRCVFLQNRVRFGDHRVAGTVAAPQSVLVCANERERHPAVNLLWRVIEGKTYRVRCGMCDSKLERAKGYVVSSSDPMAPFAPQRVWTERVAHSQLDPKTLRADPGQFHSSRVISAGQIFVGKIACSDDVEHEIGLMLRNAPVLYLGRGRTRGQGRVTLRHFPASTTTQVDLIERLRRFQSLVNRPEWIWFVCGFESAGVFWDEWLRPKLEVSAGDLHPEFGAYEKAGSFASGAAIAGWNSAAGLPKWEFAAVSPGSCFLFKRSVRGLDTELELERLAGLMVELECNGAGERLAEGFGEVTFCGDLHVWKGETE